MSSSFMEDFPIETRLTIPLFIDHERQGTYFTLPFTMPPDTEVCSLSYHYDEPALSLNLFFTGETESRFF